MTVSDLEIVFASPSFASLLKEGKRHSYDNGNDRDNDGDDAVDGNGDDGDEDDTDDW